MRPGVYELVQQVWSVSVTLCTDSCSAKRTKQHIQTHGIFTALLVALARACLLCCCCGKGVRKCGCVVLRCAVNMQIGDWGRQGSSQQKKVAKMMANVADCMPPAFIISTGDNFYSRECTASMSHVEGQRPISAGSQTCAHTMLCTQSNCNLGRRGSSCRSSGGGGASLDPHFRQPVGNHTYTSTCVDLVHINMCALRGYADGLKSSSDWQIKKTFTDVYSYSQLQVCLFWGMLPLQGSTLW